MGGGVVGGGHRRLACLARAHRLLPAFARNRPPRPQTFLFTQVTLSIRSLTEHKVSSSVPSDLCIRPSEAGGRTGRKMSSSPPPPSLPPFFLSSARPDCIDRRPSSTTTLAMFAPTSINLGRLTSRSVAGPSQLASALQLSIRPPRLVRSLADAPPTPTFLDAAPAPATAADKEAKKAAMVKLPGNKWRSKSTEPKKRPVQDKVSLRRSDGRPPCQG